MNTQDYVVNAVRTKSDRFYKPFDSALQLERSPATSAMTTDVLHAAIGISTEAGEILDVAKKTMFYGTPVDYVNLDEEMGDVLWYIAIYCNARGITLDALMAQNIAKLQARFPQAFTEDAANVRDLAAERAVLEAHSAAVETAAAPVGIPTMLPMSHRVSPPLNDIDVIDKR